MNSNPSDLVGRVMFMSKKKEKKNQYKESIRK